MKKLLETMRMYEDSQDIFNSDKWNKYAELMPNQGPSKYYAGEIIRAVNKVAYDYYNNGFGNRWDAPAAFLMDNVPNLSEDVKRMLLTYASGTSTDGNLKNTISDMANSVLDYLDQKVDINTPNNAGDMWDADTEGYNFEEARDHEYDDEDDYDPDYDIDVYNDDDDDLSEKLSDYVHTPKNQSSSLDKFRRAQKQSSNGRGGHPANYKPDDQKKVRETSYEKDMDDKKPIIVHGVKGMDSKPFTKKFKNQAAYEKWADSEAAGNFEVQQVQNESIDALESRISKLRQLAGLEEAYGDVVIPTSQPTQSEEENVTYSRTKRDGKSTVTVTANANSMDELHRMLRLAGIEPDPSQEEPVVVEPEPVEPELDAPCGCDGDDSMGDPYTTDKQALVDKIKQKMQAKFQ